MRAVETVAAGEIYASPALTALVLKRFAHRENLPRGVDALSDRELAVFSLIAAGHRPGEIAKELGISRKTIQTHCEHIKQKLGYSNAKELKRGAHDLLGAGQIGARHLAPGIRDKHIGRM